LYISSGKAKFIFDNEEKVIEEGTIIIFKPQQAQYYYYDPQQKPVIYWVHFSGREVDTVLNHYKLLTDENVFYIGVCNNLPLLFNQIIDELKLRDEKYEEMTVFKLKEILLCINRSLINVSMKTQDTLTMINDAKTYFDKNYNQNINISDYARANNISTYWLIKKFKEITGISPLQYILDIRLSTAKNLLLFSKHNISEIATIVGYHNSMYFSRLFTKRFGLSPLNYKKEYANKV
ncbi:MAG: helix-turn-helix domain-containing protein, partial [Clostridia bacterium]|nr:helix-turn-helix domain-containing protein [Clostridia bacterium]